jgi:hypothetical protein
MRPPSVYANPFCPAACPCDLLRLLHGPHRVACRLVMILLSQQGLSAAQIAGLLGYDPSTPPARTGGGPSSARSTLPAAGSCTR